MAALDSSGRPKWGSHIKVTDLIPLPSLFGIVATFCILVGGVLLFLLRPMRRLMGDVN
jgi:hypothetical protein